MKDDDGSKCRARLCFSRLESLPVGGVEWGVGRVAIQTNYTLCDNFITSLDRAS